MTKSYCNSCIIFLHKYCNIKLNNFNIKISNKNNNYNCNKMLLSDKEKQYIDKFINNVDNVSSRAYISLKSIEGLKNEHKNILNEPNNTYNIFASESYYTYGLYKNESGKIYLLTFYIQEIDEYDDDIEFYLN